MITINQLKGVCPLTRTGVLQPFVDPLNRWMEQYGINTPQRKRHFIAQAAHESGCFNYVREIASGSAYDTGRLAVKLGNTPEADGDGQKYKGRGLIQVTGKANYERCSKALFGNLSLLSNPALLEQPDNAVKSACWFWTINGLNTLADADDIVTISKRINGGTNGLDERKKLYELAKKFIV